MEAGLKIPIFIIAALAIFYLASFTYMSFESRKASGPSLKDGKLGPCPGTPNCVLSEEKGAPSYIEPFRVVGGAKEDWAKMKAAVIELGGSVEVDNGTYLWATFRSKFWRFVDDLELRLDEKEGVIHVRSASRVGKGDLGVNRKRVEALRVLFNRNNI